MCVSVVSVFDLGGRGVHHRSASAIAVQCYDRMCELIFIALQPWQHLTLFRAYTEEPDSTQRTM